MYLTGGCTKFQVNEPEIGKSTLTSEILREREYRMGSKTLQDGNINY